MTGITLSEAQVNDKIFRDYPLIFGALQSSIIELTILKVNVSYYTMYIYIGAYLLRGNMMYKM